MVATGEPGRGSSREHPFKDLCPVARRANPAGECKIALASLDHFVLFVCGDDRNLEPESSLLDLALDVLGQFQLAFGDGDFEIDAASDGRPLRGASWLK